jgi:DNA-binding transcriptional LysR family regulator
MKELSDEAFAAVAEAFGQHAGELALGASQTIGQYLLPTFVAGFLQATPIIWSRTVRSSFLTIDGLHGKVTCSCAGAEVNLIVHGSALASNRGFAQKHGPEEK